MLRRSRTILSKALFFTAVCGLVHGCASSDDTDDGGNASPDATTAADSGSNNPPADAGTTPDSGASTPDSGMMMMQCNALDGTGCTGNQACIYVGDPFIVQCRDVFQPPKTHEQQCNQQLHDCQPGFACIRRQGQNNATCHKICAPGSHMDCANLMGAADNYRCDLQLDRDLRLNACVPEVPECFPFNDMCDQMEYCEYSGGRLVCLPEGTPGRGEACPINRCQRGSICIDGMCREPCNPMNPACQTPNTNCIVVQDGGRDLPFGTCQ